MIRGHGRFRPSCLGPLPFVVILDDLPLDCQVVGLRRWLADSLRDQWGHYAFSPALHRKISCAIILVRRGTIGARVTKTMPLLRWIVLPETIQA